MKTYALRASEIQRNWYIVDAEGKTLGKVASVVAQVLRGKHKPTFSPHLDNGDCVIVVNAGRVRVTGNKPDQKVYYRHTGYPGGLRATTLKDMLERHPTRVIQHAVRGMLPKNRLGRKMIKKLKVYAGSEHRHAAQQPRPLQIEG